MLSMINYYTKKLLGQVGRPVVVAVTVGSAVKFGLKGDTTICVGSGVIAALLTEGILFGWGNDKTWKVKELINLCENLKDQNFTISELIEILRDQGYSDEEIGDILDIFMAV